MFEPSRYSYGAVDSAALVDTLAPLAISAGTQIAETAITHHRDHRGRHGKARRRTSAPVPPPPPAHSPVWPIALGLGGIAVVGLAVLLPRAKPHAGSAA